MRNLQSLDIGGTSASDDDLRALKPLRLAELSLSDTCVTDLGVRSLANFPRLQLLYLERTAITDDSLPAVTQLRNLFALSLAGTAVSDRGISQLEMLANLQNLSLENTRITDHAMSSLSRMPALANLSINGTGVSDQGILQLLGSRSLQSVTVDETLLTSRAAELLQGAGIRLIPNASLQSNTTEATPIW